jgi:hypothetical protein
VRRGGKRGDREVIYCLDYKRSRQLNAKERAHARALSVPAGFEGSS